MTTANEVSDIALDESLNPSTILFLEAIDRLRALEDARQEQAMVVPAPGSEFYAACDEMILAARGLGKPSPEEWPIALAVARFAAEKRLHDLDAERRSRSARYRDSHYPTEAFLRCLANVFEAREQFGVPLDGPPALEPIFELIAQGVSRRQIATMYGMDLQQLEQEIENPGSITGRADYVTPHQKTQQQQKAREGIEINSLGSAAAAITLKRGTQETERELAKL